MSPDLLMLSLLGAPLFTGLAPLQLKVLALTAERVSFRDGETIIRSGEDGDAAFLIVSGEVAVDLADEHGGRPRGARGRNAGRRARDARDRARLDGEGRGLNALRFSRQMMHELMQRYPGMAEHFTAKIRQRLERMAEALREIDEMLDVGDDLTAEPAPAERQAMH